MTSTTTRATGAPDLWVRLGLAALRVRPAQAITAYRARTDMESPPPMEVDRPDKWAESGGKPVGDQAVWTAATTVTAASTAHTPAPTYRTRDSRTCRSRTRPSS